ncbi:three-Cys-motif partner protein TcmP [Rudanella lutea]|uniref:three-Cys-motif partner protein TcmP n=1 Tax=Rudanella lutea TaxID=451374 RepID=UPI0003636702|nr:three-Cys-motif partner protein TcmP [Rudanella lutea]
MKNNDDFFKIQSASSRIKAKIVAEYFPQYCRILMKSPKEHRRIVYLDLFSGPGKYGDDNPSTPLLIAKACYEDVRLRDNVLLAFNDKTYAEELKKNFLAQFPEGSFRHKPRFASRTVGEDEAIQKYLSRKPEKINYSPTLLFFDPWGYKGIDTKTLATFLENWGNEIFLFVNIKRINAAIENDKFDELMESIFPTTIDYLRKDKKYKATVYDRLNLIMDNLADEFKRVTPNLYHCAFKFREEDSEATSHFIIHFCKHKRGYELVKQIFYDFDNIGACLEKDGVYTFDAKVQGSSASLSLFGDLNVLALSQQLERAYKGRTITARRLFDEHHPGKKFCASHYAKTLRKMEEEKKVTAIFTDGKQHKVSVLITDDCLLSFP